MKLTDTHLVLLSAAAQDETHLLPRPERIAGNATQALAGKLVRSGLVQWVPVRSGQPHWRVEDEAPMGLQITREGLAALGLDEPAEAIDLSFLLLVAAAVVREVVMGRNWRNLKYGVRLGIAATIMLIMLIGGRIIPSFTRNWLVRENPGRLPAPFGPFNMATLAYAGSALLAWVVAPDWQVTGAALIGAGLLQAARLARWAGDRTLRDRLILVLHVAYAFVPLGFVLVGVAAFGLLPASAGIHAWTGGAVGAMTLAVMSRSSLGHTGRVLVATWPTQALYGLVIVSALAWVCAALEPQWSLALLHVAGIAWTGAFVGFAFVYWRVLTRPRVTA